MSSLPQMPFDLDLIPIEVVAIEILGWTVKTARNRIAAGTFPIPTFKAGRRTYVRRTDLNGYVEGQAASAKRARCTK